MRFTLDNAKVADGTILIFGIRYLSKEPDSPDFQPHPKVWTYASLKAGERWYMTGTGKVPQDAGWGAVARWLDDPRREVVWVRAVSETTELWPNPDRGSSVVMSFRTPSEPDKEGAARDGVPGGILAGEEV